MLACEFEVVADCEDLLIRLDRLLPHPVQCVPVSSRHRFEARRIESGGYQVQENGRQRDPQRDVFAAARMLFFRMQELAHQALPEFTRIHAGCASRGGRRIVAAGAPRSGKSTLMARLLYEGFHVHCDDLVLLQRGVVLPYPRRFFMRRDSMALIPQLVDHSGESFEWAGWDAGGFAVDPSTLGFEWRIERAPVDAVLFLELDTGGKTRLEPCPKYAMAERLMFQSTQPAGGPGEWVRDVCAMLDRADCFVLRSGDLEDSVSALKGILRGGSP